MELLSTTLTGYDTKHSDGKIVFTIVVRLDQMNMDINI